MVMMIGDPKGGGGDGGGGGIRRPPPPVVTPPPLPPPTFTPPPTITTGGPNPPTPNPVTPPVTTPSPNLRTGGPQPPVQVTDPRNTPVPTVAPQPVPGGPPGVPAQTATSPVPVMDWRARLGQTDEQATTRGVGANETVQGQLNQITAQGSQYITQAQDRARNEASNRGMMMSTMAAGAGSRAAIDAALPIAQQDAQTYGRTASENMAAKNADSMQDQQIGGSLTGQEMGIRANLDESERARGFTAIENQRSRQFQEREMVMTQNWQTAQNNAERQQQMRVQEIQIAHDTAMQQLQRNTALTQQDKQLLQERFNSFQTAMFNQSAMLSQTIAQIYSNPNLSASQQNAAVENARKTYQSMFQSYAASMSGGLPQIFYQPYPMQ